MTVLRRALEAEIARFRAWADDFPVAERNGEWECFYADWQEIYRAFSAFVSATTCQEWDAKLKETLLYIIARDNEEQVLAKAVAKNPDDLICLAERALASPERDARWQLAAELGGLDHRLTEAEPLLLQYARDEDEYVRRRALIALADCGSSKVEELAVSAWAAAEAWQEYQRMAVLYALWKVGSRQLETYLAEADADGRQYLVAYAARIRSGNPE